MEIEPLNVVPAGSTICNCDDGETVKAGIVIANAERAINVIISRAINTTHVNVLIFFIFPLEEYSVN
jgi:hypothetical protein